MIKNKADKVTKNGVENDDNNSDEESGEVLFYVNKNGFPVGQSTWERMWNHAGKVHPAGIKPMGKIREDKDLSKVTVPTAPTFQPNTSIPCRLDAVQDYMKELQYNHTGTQFFEIRKNRPISGLMDSAKEMIRESLPIKCLEAVILSLYLTNGAPGLERFPLSFKTHFSGTIHRHVVLAVYYSGRYGALGMSRRDDLMYKPLEFKSLSELVFDFEDVYKKYWHTVRKVKIGLPVSHDPHSFEQIQWRTMSVSPSKQTRSEVLKEIEKFTKDLKSRFKWSSSYSSYQFVKENTRLNYEPTSPRKSISSSLTSKTPRKDSQASGSKETTPLSPGAVRACDSSDEEAEGVSPTPAAKKGAAIDYQIRI